MRVMIVEDSPADAYLEKMSLRAIVDEEFAVRCVGDLSAAVKLLQEMAFDVILLDLGLPESVGAETVEYLRDIDRTTPIVVLTGSDDRELVRRALDAGAQDVVTKSDLTPAKLHQAMRGSVLRMKQRQEIEGPTV